ncbi:MAG: cysteine rich repeat-containing protein [Hyphomicrobiaceae bacterium]
MTAKSLIALAFVCLAPVVAFAETAPAKVTAPAAATAPVATAPAPATAPAVAKAGEEHGSKRWKDCAGDVQKFCATVEKGKGAIRTCLESHSADLTPACKTGMAEHAAAKAAEKTGEKPAADKVVK